VWDLLPEDILLLGFLVGDNLRGPPPNMHLFDPWETAWNSYGSLEFVGFPLDIVWDLLPEDILLLGFLVVDNLRAPPRIYTSLTHGKLHGIRIELSLKADRRGILLPEEMKKSGEDHVLDHR
jgi:hypothetical protein